MKANETRVTFAMLAKIAATTEDRDKFIKCTTGSFPAHVCAHIWDVAHCNMRDIRRHTGLSQVGFSQIYNIPRRTVEDWERGIGNAPLYVRLLLAEHTGYLKIDFDIE